MRTQIADRTKYTDAVESVPTMLPRYEMEPPKQLSLQESNVLKACELIIEKGLETFEEVGQALCRIRDGLLYRQTHSSWEGYCQERWQIGARRARQLAASAEVVRNIREMNERPHAGLSDVIDASSPRPSPPEDEREKTTIPVPTSERQTRALAGLPKVEQQEVWREAVKSAPGGKVTGKDVERVIEKRRAPQLFKDQDGDAVESVPTRVRLAGDVAANAIASCKGLEEEIGDGCPKAVYEKFGQARYFLQCIRTELERIVREAEKSVKTKGAAPKLSGYVIYRPPLGKHVQQRYSTAGGWCHDPQKAKVFKDGEEARKLAFANGERVMTLETAVAKFKKWK